uniref:Uncharacterized protein n=1 Tax=Pygocentrus nattereri TaxID=42514 RepID=A0AAR2KV08_PYGNA
TMIPPPPNFTLGTMQSDKYCSPGNRQTQTRPMDFQMEKPLYAVLESLSQWSLDPRQVTSPSKKKKEKWVFILGEQEVSSPFRTLPLVGRQPDIIIFPAFGRCSYPEQLKI